MLTALDMTITRSPRQREGVGDGPSVILRISRGDSLMMVHQEATHSSCHPHSADEHREGSQQLRRACSASVAARPRIERFMLDAPLANNPGSLLESLLSMIRIEMHAETPSFMAGFLRSLLGQKILPWDIPSERCCSIGERSCWDGRCVSACPSSERITVRRSSAGVPHFALKVHRG